MLISNPIYCILREFAHPNPLKLEIFEASYQGCRGVYTYEGKVNYRSKYLSQRMCIRCNHNKQGSKRRTRRKKATRRDNKSTVDRYGVS